MLIRPVVGALGYLALASTLLPVGPATAAPADPSSAVSSAPAMRTVTATKNFNREFTKTGTVDLKPLKVCATYRLTGRIKGTRETYRHGSGIGNRWKNVRIVKPAYRITTRPYYSHPTGFTCGTSLRVHKFNLHQTWKRSGCTPGLESITVGWYPSASFGCSKEQAAKRKSSHGAGSVANQYNSSAVIRFKTFDCNGIQCGYTARARAYVKITVKTAQGTDSDNAKRDITVSLPATG